MTWTASTGSNGMTHTQMEALRGALHMLVSGKLADAPVIAMQCASEDVTLDEVVQGLISEDRFLEELGACLAYHGWSPPQ